MTADYDSPWKEALELYFRPFLALFFPRIDEDIDWSRGHEFLDKELQKIVPRSARGRQYVDKLVKVWRKNGREAWVLIHVEVQTQRDPHFARRMFGYNTRIFDRYNRKVVSIAVLADDAPDWRPDRFEDELWGWSVRMAWPAVKLLDFAEREGELESSKNPFAKVVLAHLKALETRGNPARRRGWKFRLVRGLYERGFSNEDVRQLFRVIDWVMELPPRVQRRFDHDVDEYKEARRMAFYTGIERRGMEKIIKVTLKHKFGDEGLALMPVIEEIDDGEKYIALSEVILAADSLAEVRRACEKAAAPPAGKKKGGNGKRAPKKT